MLLPGDETRGKGTKLEGVKSQSNPICDDLLPYYSRYCIKIQALFVLVSVTDRERIEFCGDPRRRRKVQLTSILRRIISIMLTREYPRSVPEITPNSDPPAAPPQKAAVHKFATQG